MEIICLSYDFKMLILSLLDFFHDENLCIFPSLMILNFNGFFKDN